jgi:hypothetical protein
MPNAGQSASKVLALMTVSLDFIGVIFLCLSATVTKVRFFGTLADASEA